MRGNFWFFGTTQDKGDDPHDDYHPKAGMIGLGNLGNTCFMNSGLQCLTHCQILTEYFRSHQFQKDLNRKNSLGMNGQIAEAYSRLLRQLWPRVSAEISESVFPRELKQVIGKYSPQFVGARQHDSHEFLSCLLDGMHEDLNRVVARPRAEPDLEDELDDDERSKESLKRYKRRNDSVIVDLFQGLFKSTIECPNSSCSNTSITFDPYMYISLPIVAKPKKVLRIPFVPSNLRHQLEFVDAQVLNSTTIRDIKTLVASTFGVSWILVAMIVNKEFKGVVPDSALCSKLPYASCLVAYELDKDPHVWVSFHSDNGVALAHPRLVKVLPEYLNHREFEEWVMENVVSVLAGQVEIRMDCIEEDSELYGSSQSWEQHHAENPIHFGNGVHSNGSTKQIRIDIVSGELDNNAILLTNTLEEPLQNHVPLGPTLFDCIEEFTKKERLGIENSWYCKACKSSQQAYKKLDIWTTPAGYLVFHLKRFSYSRISREKLDQFVDFPIETLDLRMWEQGGSGGLFDLIGISNHFGGLGGGHYTAYVKHALTGQWINCDDSFVSAIDPQRIKSPNAYVLFYKRRQ